MTILNFYIFNRTGKCVFSHDELGDSKESQYSDILCGLLYSLKQFSRHIAPTLDNDNDFIFYKNSHYQLVFYEVPTMIKFVLLLSPDTPNDTLYYRGLMADIYEQIYVPYYVQNPLTDTVNATLADSGLFRKHLSALFVAANLCPKNRRFE